MNSLPRDERFAYGQLRLTSNVIHNLKRDTNEQDFRLIGMFREYNYQQHGWVSYMTTDVAHRAINALASLIGRSSWQQAIAPFMEKNKNLKPEFFEKFFTWYTNNLPPIQLYHILEKELRWTRVDIYTNIFSRDSANRVFIRLANYLEKKEYSGTNISQIPQERELPLFPPDSEIPDRAIIVRETNNLDVTLGWGLSIYGRGSNEVEVEEKNYFKSAFLEYAQEMQNTIEALEIPEGTENPEQFLKLHDDLKGYRDNNTASSDDKAGKERLLELFIKIKLERST